MKDPQEPTPKERLVFDHTIESMFRRALKGRVTPRLKERVLELGIDLDDKLKPTYPREAWVGALHAIVEELYAGMPRERAFFELGERLVDSFRETFMGPAMLAVLRLIGPKRSLQRLAQTLLYATNYQYAKVTQLAPNVFEVWMNEAGASSQFMAGSIAAILRHSGARDPKVLVLYFDGHECRYRIEL